MKRYKEAAHPEYGHACMLEAPEGRWVEHQEATAKIGAWIDDFNQAKRDTARLQRDLDNAQRALETAQRALDIAQRDLEVMSHYGKTLARFSRGAPGRLPHHVEAAALLFEDDPRGSAAESENAAFELDTLRRQVAQLEEAAKQRADYRSPAQVALLLQETEQQRRAAALYSAALSNILHEHFLRNGTPTPSQFLSMIHLAEDTVTTWNLVMQHLNEIPTPPKP